ncbi:MAG: ABC transporter ATP-binding protein [Clostridia bacterium]|nr:ABC transporter ATP-binding protein [Clostridia bacterium]MBR5452678.1 ABC transporter ATP-binding protein [Clostridia bacterium]
MPLINCKNVTLSYENKTVINDLSFEVSEGDYLCVVGENGSGKSTLIKALLGLKPITHGSISLGEGLRKNEIGYLPQQSSVQKDFPASVYEVVLSGTLNSSGILPFYKKSDRRKAEENMARLGISELKNACYRELSGGQQQRVLLARALSATKKLLLLDEPTAGLDPIVSSDFYRIIEKLNREDGITVIMVSHEIKTAVKYATHMLHLHRHHTFFGPKEHYLECSECKKLIEGGESNV